MTRYSLIAVLTFLPIFAIAQATPQQRHGLAFGTFTSLRMHEETGDILGFEITIIPQYLSAYAIVQCGEGAPSPPVFDPVKIKGYTVSLEVHADQNACNGHYSGRVSYQGLQLNAEGDRSTEFLPRRRSYWAR